MQRSEPAEQEIRYALDFSGGEGKYLLFFATFSKLINSA